MSNEIKYPQVDERETMSNEIKYPQIEVELVGHDRHAVAIMGRVSEAMRRAGLTAEQVKEYLDEATTGTYEHLLYITGRFVTIL